MRIATCRHVRDGELRAIERKEGGEVAVETLHVEPLRPIVLRSRGQRQPHLEVSTAETGHRQVFVHPAPVRVRVSHQLCYDLLDDAFLAFEVFFHGSERVDRLRSAIFGELHHVGRRAGEGVGHPGIVEGGRNAYPLLRIEDEGRDGWRIGIAIRVGSPERVGLIDNRLADAKGIERLGDERVDIGIPDRQAVRRERRSGRGLQCVVDALIVFVREPADDFVGDFAFVESFLLDLSRIRAPLRYLVRLGARGRSAYPPLRVYCCAAGVPVSAKTMKGDFCTSLIK